MSFSYYRRTETPPPPVSYGFKQVTAKELNDIIKRVSRTTYSAKLASEEQKQVNNYVYLLEDNGRRRVVSACARSPPASKKSFMYTASDNGDDKQKRLTEREMNRLLRRLQRPTETFLNATNPKLYNEQGENLKQGKITRAKSADERPTKVVAKYRRPTTASMAKTLDTCHLCYEHENKKTEEPDAFDYDYSDQKTIPSEEMDYIVERVNKPTSASSRGRMNCYRTPVYLDEVKIRANLPLLSGLARSKNVKEITDRLTKRKRHGHLPEATVITTY